MNFRLQITNHEGETGPARVFRIDHAPTVIAAAMVMEPDPFTVRVERTDESAAGYRPRTCECGHVEGDHRCVRTPPGRPVRGGMCLEPDCDCREFTKAHAAGFSEKQRPQERR